MRHDTLILGAGLSGLAAGVRLSMAGRGVTVLERHSLWGGLNSFFKLGGRRYDTGLHALTNFFREGERTGPLARALRALRIPREALELCEQSSSFVAFHVGGEVVRLEFSNDPALLESELERAFPGRLDAWRALLAAVPPYGAPQQREPGARARLREILRDPLLCEMLFCPPCFYGNAREHDMDWDAYGVLFRSLFLEGLARPAGGIRTLLDALRARLAEEGGRLETGCGVARIVTQSGRVRGVVLDDGRELECACVLSSAGLIETLDLLDEPPALAPAPRAGAISVLETQVVLERRTAELGHASTIGFFNLGETFRYASPAPLGELCDASSGVICSPDNYLGVRDLSEGRLRVSLLADAAGWEALAEDDYAREKQRWSERALDVAAPFAFDPRAHELARDTFTPRTIRRFTGHRNGALYGSPDKRRGGELGVAGLRLIGNDEAYPGIAAALVSGVGVASSVAAGAAREVAR